jgi:3-oxoacyl-[acyl-carrier-protein] synthase-3
MLFKNVAIEALAYELPPHRVSSAALEDQIAPTMERLGVKPGRIEELSGIRERRFWDAGTQPSEVATLAGRKVIEQAGIDPARIGAVINTSVTNDYIEPATAVFVHRNLGLSQQCTNFDIRNACLGFLNGIQTVGMLIEAGEIDYGLVVNGENVEEAAIHPTIRRLQRPDLSVQEFRDNFATLTLGSGAVAMLLCHKRLATTSHVVNGAVTMAATEHNRLCLGRDEQMVTDASGLLTAGVKLVSETWQLAGEKLANWSDEQIALYAPHQVGARHVAAVAQAVGLTPAKLHLNFQTLGNIGPAAIAIGLAQAAESGRLKAGDQVGLLGVGSGINCSIMSVTW